jgi:hypothetical protein
VSVQSSQPLSGANDRACDAVDFDIHGFVGIRLIDAKRGDVGRVRRQLGLAPSALDGEPDITIRFVDRLPLSGPLRYLGLEEVGFTEQSFVVLRSKHKSRARVQIPFDRIGRPCEIVCERGLAAVPLLVPILNLTALGKGVLPLHAAAFKFRGVGVLATGWSKGGKTETLLAFMQHGAEYVGDEWCYVSRQGKRTWGLPEPIRVWRWHLDSVPDLAKRISRTDQARLGMLRQIDRGAAWLAESSRSRRFSRLAGRASPLLRKQQCVDVEPERLFGAARCAGVASLDRLLFVSSHASQEVAVERIDAADVARRMLFSLQEEQRVLMSFYRRFRFAFPERENPVLESVEQVQRRALDDALAHHTESYELRHPYPVPLEQLFDAVVRHCL